MISFFFHNFFLLLFCLNGFGCTYKERVKVNYHFTIPFQLASICLFASILFILFCFAFFACGNRAKRTKNRKILRNKTSMIKCRKVKFSIKKEFELSRNWFCCVFPEQMSVCVLLLVVFEKYLILTTIIVRIEVYSWLVAAYFSSKQKEKQTHTCHRFETQSERVSESMG